MKAAVVPFPVPLLLNLPLRLSALFRGGLLYCRYEKGQKVQNTFQYPVDVCMYTERFQRLISKGREGAMEAALLQIIARTVSDGNCRNLDLAAVRLLQTDREPFMMFWGFYTNGNIIWITGLRRKPVQPATDCGNCVLPCRNQPGRCSGWKDLLPEPYKCRIHFCRGSELPNTNAKK